MSDTIEAIGARAVARLLDAMVALAADELPGIDVARDGDRLVLTGRGLKWRWLADARLRGLAAMAARTGR